MRILRDPNFVSVLRQVEKARTRTRTVVVPGVVVILAAVPVMIASQSPLLGLALLFVGLVIAVAGSPNMVHVRRLQAGMRGELDVIRELQSLDDSWCLLNSVRLPDSRETADHILVGPLGVFVLETKNHRGGIVCEGDEWSRGNWTPKRPPRNRESMSSPSLQVKSHASLLERSLRSPGLKVSVEPVVVFTNRSAKLWLKKPTVPVLKLAELRGFLERPSTRTGLAGEEVATIAEKILAYTTTQHFTPTRRRTIVETGSPSFRG